MDFYIFPTTWLNAGALCGSESGDTGQTDVSHSFCLLEGGDKKIIILLMNAVGDPVCA